MLTLNDGRSELWQWDTVRTLSVDADCSQVHFSNKVFGRSIDVDVIDGTAIIPDVLLQTDKDLNVWAFVGTADNGYTKISKTFKVNRRNKPADYVFTPVEQTTLAELSGRLDKIEESQDPDAIKNAVDDYLQQDPVEVPVKSVDGQTGAVELTAKDVGAISQDDLQTATNEALAQAKASGEFDGADGNSAYRYAVDGGYIGTEAEFARKLASEALIVTIADNNGTLSADKTFLEIMDAILAGTTVLVDYDGNDFPLTSATAEALYFGTIMCDETLVATSIIEITSNNEVNDISASVETLPNPNAITFTGAVTGSYDGSAPLSVNIPSAVTDAHINSLIDTKLGVIENGAY